MKIWSLLAVSVAIAGPAHAIEEAAFDLVSSDGPIEIRDYESQIVAEVVVREEFDEAGNRAFRKLFNYISGNNSERGEIAMTAPVSQMERGEKIAMTSPVSQRPLGSEWAVSFMMPASFTMDSIPVPNDEAVTIRRIPPHRAAVIRYSGTWSKENFQRHLAKLGEWLAGRNLEAAGEPVWARYNGPMTPWFLRRNEIIVPLAKETMDG